MTRATCPKCHGRGFYFGPYYGDLQPKTEKLVCGCRPARPARPVREGVLLTVLFALFAAFLVAGAQ